MSCFGLLFFVLVIFCIIKAGNKKGNQTMQAAPHRQGQKAGNQPIRQNQPIVNQPIRQNQPIVNQPIRQTPSMANQPVRQNQPIMNQSVGQNRTAGGAAGYGQGNRIGYTEKKPAEAAKQQELKNRLESKYGRVSQKPQKQQELQKLQRAEEKKEANAVKLPELQEEDLIQEINDLMVKGYDGELTFSRDFVSEGIEMLNRIQM